MRRLLFFLLVSMFLLVRVSLAATPITSCGTISQSGEYYLVNDLFTSSGSCIVITNSSVKIDGMGHKIYGLGKEYDTTGILLPDSTSTNDNEIYNLVIENVRHGIRMYGTFSQCFTNRFHDIQIKNVSFGISISGLAADRNQFYNCYIEATEKAINIVGYFETFPSNENVFHDCTIISKNIAIHFDKADRNVFYRDNITGIIEFKDYEPSDTSIPNDNTFYDNIMNISLVNLTQLYDNKIYFNTTKQVETNIVGGPYIGGNYWIGYSENCTDSDGDYICDEPYVVSETLGFVDYLPLAKPPEVEKESPFRFVKSMFGIGILISFLAFGLSLISSPEISVERLFEIIGMVIAITILISIYGML